MLSWETCWYPEFADRRVVGPPAPDFYFEAPERAKVIDTLMDPAMAKKQGKLLSKLERLFTPYESLKMATSDNAELMEMAGPCHPYREGPLGEISVGAYADLILVDGNPLEDLSLVANPHEKFDLIMKDIVIYKNEVK